MKVRRSDVSIHRNIKWNDLLGEVDFVVVGDRLDILCLVECKCRLFDIAEGYR